MSNGRQILRATDDVELIDLETNIDRREVVAYVAVFNQPTEIKDFDGHYYESIDRNAFNVTLREAPEKVRAFVNHGRDIYGQPSDRFSLPYGKVERMEPDGRGLLTVTKVLETPLGDEVLELLRGEAFNGFSFSGRVLKTDKIDPIREGDLPVLVRREIALREFGPAPFQAYDDATLVAVRSGQPIELPQSSDQSRHAPAEDGSDVSDSEQGNGDPHDAVVREPNRAQLWLREQFKKD